MIIVSTVKKKIGKIEHLKFTVLMLRTVESWITGRWFVGAELKFWVCCSISPISEFDLAACGLQPVTVQHCFANYELQSFLSQGRCLTNLPTPLGWLLLGNFLGLTDSLY